MYTWRAPVFGTKFPPKMFSDGVLREMQTENNLF